MRDIWRQIEAFVKTPAFQRLCEEVDARSRDVRPWKGCVVCSGPIEQSRSPKEGFCSSDCVVVARVHPAHPLQRALRSCRVCFTCERRGRSKYCSDACALRARAIRHTRVCVVCSEPFVGPSYRYCSPGCEREARRVNQLARRRRDARSARPSRRRCAYEECRRWFRPPMKGLHQLYCKDAHRVAACRARKRAAAIKQQPRAAATATRQAARHGTARAARAPRAAPTPARRRAPRTRR